jgi:GDP/UDP-N,N'-diacetylbacillosamine 2-epimerase (hydrolysing)
MESTLHQLAGDRRIELGLCVTGSHFLPEFGMTLQHIEKSGLSLLAKIPTTLGKGTGMARAVGEALTGLAKVFSENRPDAVLLFGDRGEMVAGALAALLLNIPIFHLHGGERSGTVDEPMRHAISKMAHYHLTATLGARNRLIRLGELEENIFVTGAPGLDSVVAHRSESRESLLNRWSLDPRRKVALVVFHPVVQDAGAAGEQANAMMGALGDAEIQALWLSPNADTGGEYIREFLESHRDALDVRVVTDLARTDFLSWLSRADVMLGNSSSGVIEAASVGQWVINVGDRQRDRERSENLVDVPPDRELIAKALREVLERKRKKFSNVYGDGKAGSRVVERVATLPFTRELLRKSNAY